MYNKFHTTHIWVMEVKIMRDEFIKNRLEFTLNLLPTKAKFGFTLAEVLITLGIIGVVAALTIPNLMTHLKHKKLESQFKKTYAELNIAARTFYAQEESSVHDADVVLNSGTTTGSTNVLKKFMSYYKSYTIPSGQGMWRYFDNQKKITQQNLGGTALNLYPCDQTPVALDMVGRLYALDDTSTYQVYNSPDYGPKICVDTNGIDKPNRLGYDRFVFVFTANNAVVPYIGTSWNGLTNNKTDDTEIAKYCNYELGADMPAFTCAYFALKDKSPDGKGTYWGNFLK